MSSQVSQKKPDPEIYNLAAQRLGLSSEACVVVEDSMVGLRAAKAAGMKCAECRQSSAHAHGRGHGCNAARAAHMRMDVGMVVRTCPPHACGHVHGHVHVCPKP